MELLQLMREAIGEVCEVDPSSVDAASRLDDLGIDSLGAAQVLVELEIRLDRELPVHVLRRLDSLVTVGDVVAELGSVLDEPATASPQP